MQAKGGVPCRLRVTTPGVVVAGTAQMQQRRGAEGDTPLLTATSLRQQVTASWVFSANLHVVDVWKIK